MYLFLFIGYNQLVITKANAKWEMGIDLWWEVSLTSIFDQYIWLVVYTNLNDTKSQRFAIMLELLPFAWRITTLLRRVLQFMTLLTLPDSSSSWHYLNCCDLPDTTNTAWTAVICLTLLTLPDSSSSWHCLNCCDLPDSSSSWHFLNCCDLPDTTVNYLTVPELLRWHYCELPDSSWTAVNCLILLTLPDSSSSWHCLNCCNLPDTSTMNYLTVPELL